MYKTLKDYIDALVLHGYIDENNNKLAIEFTTDMPARINVDITISNIFVNKRKRIVEYDSNCTLKKSNTRGRRKVNMNSTNYMYHIFLNDLEKNHILSLPVIKTELQYEEFFTNKKHTKKINVIFPEKDERSDGRLMNIYISPTLGEIRRLTRYGAEPFRTSTYYFSGEYCTYGGDVYVLTSDNNVRGNFDPKKWTKVPVTKYVIYMNLSYLPIAYTSSVIKNFDVFNSSTYDSLMTDGNTIIKASNYENLLNYIRKHRKELVESYYGNNVMFLNKDHIKYLYDKKLNDSDFARYMIENSLGLKPNSINIKESGVASNFRYYVVSLNR